MTLASYVYAVNAGCLEGYVQWVTSLVMADDELDDTTGVPRYLQVAAILERGIRTGEYRKGQRVPSVVELSQQYGIAKTTASRAHAYLAQRGLVIRAPGVGMIVLPKTKWAPAEAKAAED